MAEKGHYNVVFIGHVDHGKSTLVGRLMYDAGALPETMYRKLKEEAEARGKGTFAFAYLMDNLKEERERGVTIDVNYKQLETQHRKITIIDAPGHKDFIKNMIKGTSQADVAVLVVAAKEGVQPQTKEHAFLSQVMGIKNMIIGVNKMDEVNYDEAAFKKVEEEMKKLLLIKFIFLLVFISGCQTINEKSEEIVKKENEKLSKFIGQPESELKIVMGNPDDETKDEKGSRILVYKNKK